MKSFLKISVNFMAIFSTNSNGENLSKIANKNSKNSSKLYIPKMLENEVLIVDLP